MELPSCQHDNPAGAKFCLECGGRLSPSCDQCGVPLPPGAKFCLECGASLAASDKPKAESQTSVPPRASDPRSYTPKHLADKILQSKSALEGERKQVTVPFADVKGSMEPRRIESSGHCFIGAMTQRGNGQMLRDGIMALFGAPIAHEDHGQQAARELPTIVTG